MVNKDTPKDELIAELIGTRNALEKYKGLFQRASDSIFVIDPTTMQILEVNPTAARRLGYKHDELLGFNYAAIEVLPPDHQTVSQANWVSTSSGTRFYECHHRHKDGTLIPVEVSSVLIKVAGSIVLQNFARDITQRKQFEAEREGLIDDLDAFTETVAHDLKNPLGVVQGYVNLLTSEDEEFTPEQIQEYLHNIRQASQKMNHIIRELLLLANVRRVDNIDIDEIDMVYVIREAVKRLTWLIEKHQAEIILPDPQSWPRVLGHAAWVEGIWTNYISNAIKYGGMPPCIEVGASPDGNGMVRFWVRDNGQGLTPDEQARLFAPFTRLTQARTDGHGLGLSIVRRIAEKLNGEVGVESQPGVGSVFSFTLPQANQ